MKVPALCCQVAPLALEDFVTRRRRQWWQPPPQRIWRCVDHTLSLIVRRIERNTSRALFGAADLACTTLEVEQFLQRQQAARGERSAQAAVGTHPLTGIGRRPRDYGPGGRTHADEHGECGGHEAREAATAQLRGAAAAAEAALLEALGRVGAFTSLSRAELAALRDRMVEAPFEQGESVFEQGEVGGRTLYIVVSGRAVALRTEPPAVERAQTGQADDDDEACSPSPPPLELPRPGLRCNRSNVAETLRLCELEVGAFFGEGVLLDAGGVRYASIQATTPLRTMAITREQIEAALGRPLGDVVRVSV